MFYFTVLGHFIWSILLLGIIKNLHEMANSIFQSCSTLLLGHFIWSILLLYIIKNLHETGNLTVCLQHNPVCNIVIQKP